MLFKGAYYWLMQKWYARKAVPCDGAGIDAYSNLSPMEQRIKRLEEGRNADYEFYCDVLDRHQERIEALEEKTGL